MNAKQKAISYLKKKDKEFLEKNLSTLQPMKEDDVLFIFCNKAITIGIKEVFRDLKKSFPKTLQPLGTKKETMIPKWKAIKAIGILIDELEKRHLSTLQK